MSLTRRDADQLVADIRRVNTTAHAIALRISGGAGDTAAAFLGGLESVLQHFLRKQGCPDAARALADAMNRAPTEAEIGARNAALLAPPKRIAP